MLLHVTDAHRHLYRKHLFIFCSVFSFNYICSRLTLSHVCQKRNKTVHLKSYSQASSIICASFAKQKVFCSKGQNWRETKMRETTTSIVYHFHVRVLTDVQVIVQRKFLYYSEEKWFKYSTSYQDKLITLQ